MANNYLNLITNKSSLIVFLLLALLFFVSGCIQPQKQPLEKPSQELELSFDTLCIEKKACIQIERAVTPQEQSKGLMFRENLGQNSGMIFLFSDSSPKSFWMKNTLIPLDMIWIDENKRIVGITTGVQPCSSDTCPSYPSGEPVKFVLEVNAGFSEKNGLKTGDSIEFLE